MSIRLILAASAALSLGVSALALPASAQDAAPVAAPAPAPSAEDLAIQTKAQAFGMTIQTMVQEMMAASDDAAADAVVARYQPQIDAFSADVDAYFAQGLAKETDPAKKAEMEQARAEAVGELQGLGQKIKTEVRAHASAAPAPAAPQ